METDISEIPLPPEEPAAKPGEKTEKELSWEKIAAEIADDSDEAKTQEVEKPSEEENKVSDEKQPEPEVTQAEEAPKVVTPEVEPQSEVVEPSETIETSQVEEVPPAVEEPQTEPQIQQVPEGEPQPEEVTEQECQAEEVTVEESQSEEVTVEESQAEEVTVEESQAEEEPQAEAVTEEVSEEVVLEPQAEEVVEESQVEETECVEPIVEEPVEPEEVKVEEEKDEVEIAEVAPETSVVCEEGIEEVEYTVVESEDVEETNEIIAEHLANTKKSIKETVVIINPDESQTEITIEQMEDSERDDSSQDYTEEIYVVTKENDETVDDPEAQQPAKVIPIPREKPKKQRGRKSTTDIPLHVLGRDITKPIEGVSNGGRIMPKPRLGVKVPYRNLTSQIVSKQDIEKEIMERFKSKQEQSNANSGDLLFARKLTQRLAKKLINTDKEREESEAHKNSEFQNDSDLIAILEGDGDDLTLSQEKQEQVIEKVKQTEREIALQQLKELPLKEEKEKVVEKKRVESKVPVPQKVHSEKKQVEVEPRLKTGVVVKTYTRKRRSTDMDIFLPPKKSTVVTTIKTEDGSPGSVYVTKSSRIIKRKVIWDPAEAGSKSPSKIIKTEPVLVKTVERKEAVEKKVPTTPIKKVIVTKSSPPIKKPKRLTEVDKLLMDEGAVNMLYDVKNNDEPSPKKKNKSVISLDKAHKELMSKTNVIKNDLQQNTNKDVQKSLRKKEIVSPTSKKEVKKELTPTRKKSKDSTMSQSPPPSPFNVAEASRIIRRHSSSSFSSKDGGDDEDQGAGEEKPKAPKKRGRKPKEDKNVNKEVVKNNNNTVTETKTNHVAAQFKAFTTAKRNNLVTIKLQSVEGKCYLNEQVLKELTSCLKDFGKDEDCHVVSIVSDSSESFCEGLDYTQLVSDEATERKKKANELAVLVKDFLRCLLSFPKVLVAGIQGECVGLGVTMLPLFDLVIASDTSNFTTPYCKLDSVPEAGFLLGVPYLSSNGLANELLYTGKALKADDACRRGLVTKLCWPEKYQQELKTMLQQIAGQSVKSIMATKQQLRENWMENTEKALSAMTKVLVEYWTSPECQESFTK